MSAEGEGNSVLGRRLHTLEVNLTNVKELSKVCWGFLGISRWFGMCKNETKAPDLAQLEPHSWLLDWRNSCNWEANLPPALACVTHPALTGHAFGCYHTLWLIFHFTAGVNHTAKLGELEWKTVLKLWTDGIGIFFSNECIAAQKKCVFRCWLVTGQVKWVLGTRAAGSADMKGAACTLGWAVCGSYFCINISK